MVTKIIQPFLGVSGCPDMCTYLSKRGKFGKLIGHQIDIIRRCIDLAHRLNNLIYFMLIQLTHDAPPNLFVLVL